MISPKKYELVFERGLSVSHIYTVVKIEPYARMEATFHGGPTLLALVPVLAYYAPELFVPLAKGFRRVGIKPITP